MRHFDFLSDAQRNRLFHLAPRHFTPDDDLDVLAIALGATLYSPATRPNLAGDIAGLAAQGVTSMVVCLEDAISDLEVPAAEVNAIAQLRALGESGVPRPLVFVRVRTADQIPMLAEQLGEHLGVLTGFVLPKFTEDTGPGFLEAVTEAVERSGRRLLAMPVLESPEVAFAESRTSLLLGVRTLLDKYRELVLAVRIGATDLSAAYGLRRPRDLTVYDVRVIADVISDIVNVMARANDDGFVVTGPVWEYFPGATRMFKPQLRQSPFAEVSEQALRTELIAQDLDGLIREVALDAANGLVGKTVIHPTHVAAVHALSVVTHEAYCDARDVLDTDSGGGVRASTYRNKMNESKPHTSWAQRIMRRAHVFGVANSNVSFVDLLGAGLHR
jgi:citrate lyase beta subunit